MAFWLRKFYPDLAQSPLEENEEEGVGLAMELGLARVVIFN